MKVQIDRIVFRRDEDEDTDGYVIYLITKPCTERPCTHVCTTHLESAHHYERQLFRRGGPGYRKNASEADKASNRANVWGWNENQARPTLTPSFLANRSGDASLGYTLHSYVRDGRLDLCGDSTVTLVEPAVECVEAGFEGEDGG
jgi:hypothetical protein